MTPPYHFLRDGLPEKVNREDWRWVAFYHDGSYLKQFGDDGVFHQFSEIDQSRLHVFAMEHDELPSVAIIFEPGDKLIHGYRRLGLDFTGEHVKVTLYKFGVIRGGQKFLNVIMPNNEIIQTNNEDKIELGHE